jgi:flagellar biosynthesis chaperone FliJ
MSIMIVFILYTLLKINKMEDVKSNSKRMVLGISLFVVSLIAVAGFLVAYVQYDQKKEFVASAAQEQQNREKVVMDSYARIESNLARIGQYENMISQNMTDAENNSALAPEERIENEINMIEQLINENNNLIASLNKQIDEKDSRLAGYQKSVKDLQARVGEYKDMVNALVADKEVLQKNLDETTYAKNNLQVKVTSLDSEITAKASLIDQQNQQLLDKEKKLNTAYYKVGTYKALHEQNVVDKEGGFLGMNREKTLASGADREKFSEIDIREVTEIPVDAKRCEIITGQDPSSYSLVYDNDKVSSIKISDPVKFWGKSKYLVVVVRESNPDEMTAYR